MAIDDPGAEDGSPALDSVSAPPAVANACRPFGPRRRLRRRARQLRGAWPRRCRPRTRRSSRCRTPARPSGTWRTPPGSSRPSSSRRTCPATGPSTDALRLPLQLLLRGGRRAAPAARSAGLLTRPTVGRGRRLPRPRRRRAWRALLAERRRRRVAARSRRCSSSGSHHEQQHQELLLTDILQRLRPQPAAPGLPAARTPPAPPASAAAARRWIALRRRPAARSATTADGFAFDNEGPRHRVYLEPFALADRPVTNGEWLAFIADGGYRRPELWLSDGWAAVQAEGWQAPLYWERTTAAAGAQMTPRAACARSSRARPVCHVSYYEADAYARWAGRAAADRGRVGGRRGREPARRGNFRRAPAQLRPRRRRPAGRACCQLFGDVWEWTASAYAPYPRLPPGGRAPSASTTASSCATRWCCAAARAPRPPATSAPTYRNFFSRTQRWQFSGLRLAEDA